MSGTYSEKFEEEDIIDNDKDIMATLMSCKVSTEDIKDEEDQSYNDEYNDELEEEDVVVGKVGLHQNYLSLYEIFEISRTTKTKAKLVESKISKNLVFEGNRDDHIFKYISKLRRSGLFTDEKILQLALDENRDFLQPPLEEEVIREKVRRLLSGENIRLTNAYVFQEFVDDEIGENMLAKFKDEIFYNEINNTFYNYEPETGKFVGENRGALNKRRWKALKEEYKYEITENLKVKYDDVKRKLDVKKDDESLKGELESIRENMKKTNTIRRNLGKSNFKSGVLKSIKEDDTIFRTDEYFNNIEYDDVEEDIKNIVVFKNCALNIETKEQLPFSKKYRKTVGMNINYLPHSDYKKSKFYKFLCDILVKDEDHTKTDYEKIALLRYACGVAISNETQQNLYLLYGSGGNGKSAFLNTMISAFGEMHGTLKPERLAPPDGSIVQLNPNAPESDIIALAGRNLIVMEETSSNCTFNDQYLKSFCSNMDHAAREPYAKRRLDIRKSGTIFFALNNLPKLNTQEKAVERRIQIIKFAKELSDKEMDLTGEFEKSLQTEEELNALIQFCLEGYQESRKKDIVVNDICSSSKILKQQYMEDENFTNRFINCFVLEKNNKLKSSERKADLLYFPKHSLYDYYKEACHNNDAKIIAKGEFFRTLASYGLKVPYTEGGNPVKMKDISVEANSPNDRVPAVVQGIGICIDPSIFGSSNLKQMHREYMDNFKLDEFVPLSKKQTTSVKEKVSYSKKFKKAREVIDYQLKVYNSYSKEQ